MLRALYTDYAAYACDYPNVFSAFRDPTNNRGYSKCDVSYANVNAVAHTPVGSEKKTTEKKLQRPRR